MVLDGPVDANSYINTPQANLREQTAGFERELGRFFQACAAYQSFCKFGDDDPWAAFDNLVAQANTLAIPAPTSNDPRPVNGDVIDLAAYTAMYSKISWADFADALAKAQAGDASGLRDFADSYWGVLPDGSYDPISDRYFMIGAIEQRYTSGVQQYLDAGDNSWGMFDHFSFNTGYLELNYGLWPIHADDVFRGPFHVPASAQTILEVATTYDPATPYRGAKRLAAQLGNVRLLTMTGDGHTAFGGNSPCIDDAVITHIETLTLPASGTTCQQMVPFVPPPATSTLNQALARTAQTRLWPRAAR